MRICLYILYVAAYILHDHKNSYFGWFMRKPRLGARNHSHQTNIAYLFYMNFDILGLKKLEQWITFDPVHQIF